MAFATTLLSNLMRVVIRRRKHGPAHPDWGHRIEATVLTLREGGEAQLAGSLDAWRAGQEIAAATVPLARGVRQRSTELGGVHALELTPRRWDSTLLYLHGGGYVTGSSVTHRALASRIAAASGARAYVIDYRLAPEHPFPAAIEDTVAAAQDLMRRGPIWIAGDSAGGGLALASMLVMRERGLPLPEHAALLCPWVDMEGALPSIEENVPYDWGDRRTLDFYARHYADGDARNPLISPIHASLEGLPPLIVQYGGAELLRDECRLLVEHAHRDGVSVEAREWPGMVHDFQIFAPYVPQSRAAIAEIGALVRARHTSAVL